MNMMKINESCTQMMMNHLREVMIIQIKQMQKQIKLLVLEQMMTVMMTMKCMTMIPANITAVVWIHFTRMD